jgi:hypothetical protein
MAFTSMAFFLASVILIRGASGEDLKGRKLSSILTVSENGRFIGLLALFPLLLYPTSSIAAYVLIALEVIGAGANYLTK